MKKLILFLFILSISNLYSQNYWVSTPSPVSTWLYRCDFVDTMTGYAVGEFGVIIKTSNGGNSWVVQNSGITDFIISVSFINPNTGWAVAINVDLPPTKILRTTNGGTNWISWVYPDTNANVNAIVMQDSVNIWMVGSPGLILKTTNNGLNWTRKDLDTGFYQQYPVRNIMFHTPTYGYAVGGHYDYGSVIWRTTDGGDFWADTSLNSEPYFAMHVFEDSLRAIAVGGDFEYGTIVSRTYDAGRTWVYRPLEIFGIAQNIKFRTATEIWLPLGAAQKFIFSNDSGSSWFEWFIPDTVGMYDCDIIDSLHGWAVGSSGSIMKYNTSLIGIDDQKFTAEQFRLHQNYPNPFNPVTTIEFYLERPNVAEIIIYDLTGREADRVKLGYLHSGLRRIQYDASKLSSGVYFYKLNTEKFSAIKKMIVLK